MAKTSPPHCVTLLIGLLLSGCSQTGESRPKPTKPDPTGWWCLDWACWREQDFCERRSDTKACVHFDLAWCPDRGNTDLCFVSEPDCEKSGHAVCRSTT